MILNGGAVS
jgi:hypothetical protein